MPAGIGYGDKMAMSKKAMDPNMNEDDMKAKKANMDEDKDDTAKKAMPPALAAALKEKDGKKKDDGDDAEKSLSDSDLRKSLDMIEEHIAKSGAGRKQELLSKAMSGAASDQEQHELAGLLAGTEPTLGTEMTKSLDPIENEQIAKSVDASEYLDQLHDGLMSYCRELGDTIQKSQSHQDEFNVVLAKGLLNIGRAVEGLMSAVPAKFEEVSKSVQELGSQPVGRPRAIGVGQAMQKSFAGQPTEAETLTKSQTLDILDEMHLVALQKSGEQHGRAFCGERLDEAITKFEQLSQMSPSLHQEVMQYRAQKNRTAGPRW